MQNVLDFVSIWSFFLSFGAILNQACRLEFRHRVATAVFGLASNYAPGTLALESLTRQFLEVTLFRLFGPKTFSARSLLISSFLSTGFFILFTVFLQVIYKHPVSFTWSWFVTIFKANPFWPIMAVVICLALDWLSYAQTSYMMRYASKSGSLIEIVFIAYADIVLSINIFVFLFPVAVIAFTLGVATLPYTSIVEFEFQAFTSDFTVDNLRTSETIRRRFHLPVKLELMKSEDDAFGRSGVASAYLLGGESLHLKHPHTFAAGAENQGVFWGVFRYRGMRVQDVATYLGGRLTQLPGLSKVQPYTDSEISVSPKNAFNSTFIALTPFDPELHVTLKSFLTLTLSLYSVFIRTSQVAQASFPEVLWNFPVVVSPLGNEYFDTVSLDLLRLTSLDLDNIPDVKPTFMDDCDGVVSVSGNLPDSQRRCGQRVVLESNPQEIELLTRSPWLTNFAVPIGVSFLSSVFITSLFYVALFGFILFSYIVRLVATTLPQRLRSFLDSAFLEAFPITAIFTIGGFFAALSFTVVKSYLGGR